VHIIDTSLVLFAGIFIGDQLLTCIYVALYQCIIDCLDITDSCCKLEGTHVTSLQ